ncbi:S-adenosyl-L-methionine-dependent methyltransferase [Aulographum hederae CBS 113979]|uniref:S-adenosyl-L-methionine-dependent methyltransferase n=1 Tax=Aulographum hederae CBS 113979 TaxID=1176131 RepID=A0A6G1HFS1_9PEZI|nr:S-adenosyl-L-methionine-dependent methyltransferase [Aulographum hederae CBS 113979]
MAEPPVPQVDLPANLKSRLKASHDAIAPQYHEWTILHSTTRLHYLDQLLEQLPLSNGKPISILELGCGCGVPVTQKLLSHPNFSITANDLSTAQLTLARATLPSDHLTLVEGDMLALDFAPATFDAVVGMYLSRGTCQPGRADSEQRLSSLSEPRTRSVLFILAPFESRRNGTSELSMSSRNGVYCL